MPCPPGCTCGHHNRPRKLDWSSREEKNAYLREYRAARREEIRAKAREKYRANPEPVRAANRARYAADPGKYREAARRYKADLAPGVISSRNRKTVHNVSDEEIARRFREQGGLCYMCSEPIDLLAKRGFHVDHDRSHCRGRKSCGLCVLGLSCPACNAGCGHFGDDPARMRRVADRREAAMTALRLSLMSAPTQDELPINVVRLGREHKESA